MRQLCASLLGALCLSATAAAAEDPIVLMENNIHQTIDCNARDVEVNSNNNKLALTGTCQTVRVAGNNNTLAVEAAVTLRVLGNHNEVQWAREVNGKKPVISNLGKRNTISQSASAPAAAAPPSGTSATVTAERTGSTKTVAVGTEGAGVTITGSRSATGKTLSVGGITLSTEGSGRSAAVVAAAAGGISIMDNDVTQTFDCAGQDVSVAGNDNNLTFRGDCQNVSVTGNDNYVKLEGVARLSVMGSKNEVTYRRGVGGRDPAVSSMGKQNTVSKK